VINHRNLELAKWIALITMTIDHFGKIVDPSLYYDTNAIGRLTYPLFAWIIGTRLAIHPGFGRRYLALLVPWALVTQPVYVFVGKDWTDPNILFTLALGVSVHCALQMLGKGKRTLGIFAIIVAIFLGAFVADYGIFGVLMIPIVARLSTYRIEWGALSSGPLGVLSNVMLKLPYFGPGGLFAVFASVIAVVSLRLKIKLPRIPKHAFYAYYPVHLLLLHLLSTTQ
jgi:hypothetical protein